jgi:SAM-dependent methyltransferase
MTNRSTWSLTDSIKSEESLRQQYRDSSNLAARAAIYRYGVSPRFGPVWMFEQLLAKLRPRADVLELGCGPGTLWKQNFFRVPEHWRVTLADLMPGMVAEAKQTVCEDERFTVRVMDAQKLDLPDASMDAVVANHMLYHVPQIPQALSEIRRVLRRDGYLFASTNSETHMLRIKQLLFEYLADGSGASSHIPFSLENGQAQLRPFFDCVELSNIQGELRVTDADAIVRYVLSIEGAPQRLVGGKLSELHDRIADEIRQKGAYVIATHVGLFIAHGQRA